MFCNVFSPLCVLFRVGDVKASRSTLAHFQKPGAKIHPDTSRWRLGSFWRTDGQKWTNPPKPKKWEKSTKNMDWRTKNSLKKYSIFLKLKKMAGSKSHPGPPMHFATP